MFEMFGNCDEETVCSRYFTMLRVLSRDIYTLNDYNR